MNGKVRHRLKLRHKILLIFIIAWAVSICAIGFFTIYGRIHDRRNAEIRTDAANLSVCRSQLEKNLENVNLTAIRFAINNSVSEMMSGNFTTLPEEEQQRILTNVNLLLYDNEYRAVFRMGFSAAFVCEDGRVYANPTMYIRTVDPAQAGLINLPDPAKLPFGYTISCNEISAEEDSPTYAQYVRGFYLKNSDEHGAIVLLLPNELLTSPFAGVTDRTWALVGKDGHIIASNDEDVIRRDAGEAYGVKKLMDPENGSSGYEMTGKYLISYTRDDTYDLTCLIVTTHAQILGNATGYILGIVLTTILAGIVLIWLSWYLSRRFTAPLEKLGNIMQQAEDGNMDVRMHADSDDEIGRISANFDRMLGRLQTMMNDISRVEKEKRDAEMTIMELQIKPHFLYNTLSSIIWLASEEENERVIDITKALAMFYRIALSEGQEHISVQNEVDNCRYYTKIQLYRYQNKFVVEYDIDPQIGEQLVPKLILQPLVENSINHGMKLRADNSGIIRVTGHKEKDQIIFEVADNGDAVTEDELEAVNASLEDGTSGIGTSSVHNRIRSYYGREYGLHYERKDGFTIARVNIPEGKKADSEI